VAASSAPAAPKDNREKMLERAMSRHQYSGAALIEVLHTAQELFGYLSPALLKTIARKLKLPPSRVLGVATFYHFFSLKPKGEHTFVVCIGTACYVAGGFGLVEKLEHRCAKAGHTTDRALGHPVLLLEMLGRLALRAPGDEVVHETQHADQRVLCDLPCEVLVSGRKQRVRELLIHPVTVHKVLSGHGDERVRICESHKLRPWRVENRNFVEEDAPSGRLGLRSLNELGPVTDQRLSAASRGRKERGWFLPVREAIQHAQGELHSGAPGRSRTGLSGSGIGYVHRPRAAPMEMHCVKKGVLVVAVNGAHCRHRVVDVLAADHFAQQALDALCCRCGPDRERERDDVCWQYRAVVDDRSSESRAFAGRKHEEFAAVRSTQRHGLSRPDVSVVPQREVMFALQFVVVSVSGDDHDMRTEGVDRHLQASRG